MSKRREYDYLKRIYNERLSRQGANQYTERASDKDLSDAPTRKAAEAIGVGVSSDSLAGGIPPDDCSG